jgi:hypothetical protein
LVLGAFFDVEVTLDVELLAVVEEIGEDVALLDDIAFVDLDVLDHILKDGGADGDFLEGKYKALEVIGEEAAGE